jgi:hypothetical protein
VSPLFFIFKRGGCFAVSDQPTLSAIAASLEVGKAEVPIAYHIGVRLGLWLAHLSNYTDLRFIFAQLISVRCRLSFVYHVNLTMLLLGTLDLFRLPQHGHLNLGECDDRRLVHE